MTFAEALPYISTSVNVLVMVGGLAAFLLTQARQYRANAEARAAQHAENVGRLDQLTERLKAVEETGKRQTDILVSFGRIEERVNGHDGRLAQLENREVGRRVAAAKGS